MTNPSTLPKIPDKIDCGRLAARSQKAGCSLDARTADILATGCLFYDETRLIYVCVTGTAGNL